MLSNVDSNYKIVYILPMQLPEVDAEPNKHRVSIPTVALPDDAQKITSPVPYVMFTPLGNCDSHFIPAYNVQLEYFLTQQSGALPPPSFPCNDTSIPSIPILIQAWGLSHQLSQAQEEQRIANEDSSDCIRKVLGETVLDLGVRPLPLPAFPSMGKILLLTSSKMDGQLKPRRGYVITPTLSPPA